MSRKQFWQALSLATGVILTGCGSSQPASFGPAAADYSYDLSVGYQLVRSSAQSVSVAPKGAFDPSVTPELPAKIVRIAWDDTVILAEQHLLDKQGQPVTPAHFNYWILDVKALKRHGPFDAKAFARQRAALNVPAALQLQNVESFKP